MTVIGNSGEELGVNKSKLIPSSATAGDQGVICQNYLDSKACEKGTACPLVHCTGKEFLWKKVPLPQWAPDGERKFDPGFTFNMYDANMTSYLEVPSERVLSTLGALNYMKEFNDSGVHVRVRFKVCKNFFEGKCTKGGACTFIHIVSEGELRSNAVHCNYILDDISSSRYPVCPEGLVIRVYGATSRGYDDVPSGLVYETQGSMMYMDSLQKGGAPPKMRMQHCAHFKLKSLCNRGAACSFIHVATVDPDAIPGSLATPDSAEVAQSERNEPAYRRSPPHQGPMIHHQVPQTAHHHQPVQQLPPPQPQPQVHIGTPPYYLPPQVPQQLQQQQQPGAMGGQFNPAYAQPQPQHQAYAQQQQQHIMMQQQMQPQMAPQPHMYAQPPFPGQPAGYAPQGTQQTMYAPQPQYPAPPPTEHAPPPHPMPTHQHQPQQQYVPTQHVYRRSPPAEEAYRRSPTQGSHQPSQFPQRPPGEDWKHEPYS